MEKAVTVSALSRLIKQCIESRPELSQIWVKGEISGLTYHSSGHIYFSLKDQDALIQAAFFRSANAKLTFRLTEGMSIIALGSVSTYEKRGNYQLIVTGAVQDGMGELQQRIEELRRKLAAEGLFAPERKRPFPLLPRRIGIVTSPTGAALRDMLKVALRRHPKLEILFAPAKVQGDSAAASIVRAIEELNNPRWDLDIIIAGRGGGSPEDLAAFSEESVVRAFAASRLPIISAVGHQIDHPVCDEAADHAAPTPSAAAEFAVPDRTELSRRIETAAGRLEALTRRLLESGERHLTQLTGRRVMRNPLAMLEMPSLDLDHLTERLTFSMREKCAAASRRIPEETRLTMIIRSIVREKNLLLGRQAASIDQLSPLATLARGYAIALDARGQAVKSVDNAAVGDHLDIVLADGRLGCTVERSTRRGIDGNG